MTNIGGIGSSGVDISNKIYRIQGSSYDGCNGWSNWLTDTVYLTQQAANKDCAELSKNKYARYEITEKIAKY